MDSIMINSIIEFILDSDNKALEAVLWIDNTINLMFTIQLNNKKSLPQPRRISDIIELLNSHDAKVLKDYQYSINIADDKDIKMEYKKIRDVRWNIIRDLVICEPEIYYKKHRHRLINQVLLKGEVKTTKASIYKFLNLFWTGGKTLSALIPHFNNCGNKGQEKPAGEKKRGRANYIGVAVNDEIKKKVISGYGHFHLDQKYSKKKAYVKTLGFYFTDGYRKNEQGTLVPIISDATPSFKQFCYWGENTYSTKQHVLAKYGEKQFNLNHRENVGYHEPPVGPGQVFEIDATVADEYLVSRLNLNHIIGRPVIYMIIDIFSRLIAGFFVGLEGPSWLGAMMALYNTFRNKVALCKEYGITISEDEWPSSCLPDNIIADRGEFAGELPRNMINNLGVHKLILPSYRADWKGSVEGTFKDFNNKTIHWLEGAVTKDYGLRGEKDIRLNAIINLYQFIQIIIYSILRFNNRFMPYYKRSDILVRNNIQSIPTELWKWGITHVSGSPRTFSEDIVKLNLMYSKECTINYRGVQFNNRRYFSRELQEAGYYAELREKGSIKKTISFDPRNYDYIYVNEGDRFLRLDCIEKTHRNMFFEEIECLNSIGNSQKKDFEHDNVLKEVEMDANIDAIRREAQKNAAASHVSMSKSKRIKNIDLNAKAERESLRHEQGWLLGDGASVKNNVVPLFGDKQSDEYIPRPSYKDIIKRQEREDD